MKLKTKNFGIIEYNNEDVLHFEDGILGFEGLHDYILLSSDEDTPFKWLQSLDNIDIVFVIIDPRIIIPDYTINVTADTLKSLEIDDVKHTLTYVIVVIPEKIEKMTADMKAPIIINAKNNKAMQIILEDDRYDIKYPILKELKRANSNT